jgi:hypothetical protein
MFPMISKVLEDTKPDVKSGTLRLIGALQKLCPEELRLNIPYGKLQPLLK